MCSFMWPRRGNQPPRRPMCRKEKSGGRRGGAVGAAGGFTKMKCCSRAPKGKIQVGKKKK
ncbi:hypothetical protein ACOSQ3_018730 [Xanthoceras sorbifolium]